MSQVSAVCAVCGSRELRTRWRVKGEAGGEGLIPTTDQFGTALDDIDRCAGCGHMQLHEMPTAAELESAYADAESGDYVEEAAGQRATAAGILAEIERLQKPGELLDLGCWVGFFLAEARERGWNGVGIEPSEFASSYAREELALDVRTAGIDELPPDREFDAVFLGDVIEHLPDPGAALTQLHGVIRPGGILAMAVPDAGSRLARLMGRRWWSVIPTHVHYFDRAGLKRLLETRGFEVCDISTAPKTFTLGYYLDRLAAFAPPLAPIIRRLLRVERIAGRQVALDFGDRMLVLARKAG